MDKENTHSMHTNIHTKETHTGAHTQTHRHTDTYTHSRAHTRTHCVPREEIAHRERGKGAAAGEGTTPAAVRDLPVDHGRFLRVWKTFWGRRRPPSHTLLRVWFAVACAVCLDPLPIDDSHLLVSARRLRLLPSPQPRMMVQPFVGVCVCV